MGPIKVGEQIIINDGQNTSAEGVVVTSDGFDQTLVITQHQEGSYARVNVDNGVSFENKLMLPGNTKVINGLKVTHERE